MLRYLLESQAKPARRAGGTAISVGAHTAIIGLAIVATARATPRPTDHDVRSHPVIYRTLISRTFVPHRTTASPWGQGPSVICDCVVPPIAVGSTVPSMDIGAHVTKPDDFTGSGIASSGPFTADGAAGLASPSDSLFTLATVDKPAIPRPDNPKPVYPVSLRDALVEGTVVAQFVVDSAGRAEPRSIVIVSTTHPLFGDAVRQTLLRSRYLPAMAGGRTVRQVVEQRFAFTLTR